MIQLEQPDTPVQAVELVEINSPFYRRNMEKRDGAIVLISYVREVKMMEMLQVRGKEIISRYPTFMNWLAENCTGSYVVQEFSVIFEKEEDAVLCYLRHAR